MDKSGLTQTGRISDEELLTQLQYNIEDTAKLLGNISTKSVRRLLERGLLKANPALRHKMITRESILRFIRL